MQLFREVESSLAPTSAGTRRAKPCLRASALFSPRGGSVRQTASRSSRGGGSGHQDGDASDPSLSYHSAQLPRVSNTIDQFWRAINCPYQNEVPGLMINPGRGSSCRMSTLRNVGVIPQCVDHSNSAPGETASSHAIFSFDPRPRRLSSGNIPPCGSFLDQQSSNSVVHCRGLSRNTMDSTRAQCEHQVGHNDLPATSIRTTDVLSSTMEHNILPVNMETVQSAQIEYLGLDQTSFSRQDLGAHETRSAYHSFDNSDLPNVQNRTQTTLQQYTSSLIYMHTPEIIDIEDHPHIFHANEPVLGVQSSMSLCMKVMSNNTSTGFDQLDQLDQTQAKVLSTTPDGDCQGLEKADWFTCSRKDLIQFRIRLFARVNGIQPIPNRILWGYHNRNTPFQPSRLNQRAISKISHYQLRNRLVCNSRHHAYYPSKWQVFHVDPSAAVGSSDYPETVMDLECFAKESRTDAHISTINTVCDNILMAGTFSGQYAYISLDTQQATPKSLDVGRASDKQIINYIDSTPNSPNGPTAVIACNDYEKTLAFIDCTRNQVVQSFNLQKCITRLPCPERAIVNCTTTSSDGRIRLLVGDFASALVTDARTGQVIHEISNTHDETGTFSCAWAPSGPTFATAGEDKCVRIWDARMWKPTAELKTFMAPVRNLKFSPLGQGPPTLFAGEAMDLVHVLDVGGSDDMWWTRHLRHPTLSQREATDRQEWIPTQQVAGRMQLLHHFGDNSGMAISPDGGELMVANGDSRFGGLMVWERTSWTRPSHERLERRARYALPEQTNCKKRRTEKYVFSR
jgi:WD40 repeat protein